MNYIDFDESRKYDLILLGRVSIDFNPAYSDDVKEDFKPLKKKPAAYTVPPAEGEPTTKK